jgi:hypothetical protein
MSPYRNKSTSSFIVGFVREDAKENEIEKVFFLLGRRFLEGLMEWGTFCRRALLGLRILWG